MKITRFICIVLSVLLFSSCAGENPAGKDDKTTTTATTTEPHIHLEAEKFPDTVDFSNEEEVIRMFDMCSVLDGVDVRVIEAQQTVNLKASVNGTAFALNINLSGASGKTTPAQIVTCARLFWYCYPQMYARFAHSETPKMVTLKFEDFGYEVASASGGEVHIHDQWLKDNPNDYDCLTHEFSHIIQGGWDGGFVPSYGDDTYMIERFADYCRYLYSYRDGRFNDLGWTLQTSKTEDTYYKSVRFWVWLDYTYSTKEIDIINRIAQQIAKEDRKCIARNWEPEGDAWETVFKGTGASGKNLYQLWDEYTASEMADLSSNCTRPGLSSPLIKKFPLRRAIRDRYPEADDYIKPEKK